MVTRRCTVALSKRHICTAELQMLRLQLQSRMIQEFFSSRCFTNNPHSQSILNGCIDKFNMMDTVWRITLFFGGGARYLFQLNLYHSPSITERTKKSDVVCLQTRILNNTTRHSLWILIHGNFLRTLKSHLYSRI